MNGCLTCSTTDPFTCATCMTGFVVSATGGFCIIDTPIKCRFPCSACVDKTKADSLAQPVLHHMY